MAALRRGTAPHAALARLRSHAGRALTHRAHELLEFLLPQRCPGCAAAADAARVLCERCHARLQPLPAPVCARCLLEDRTPDGCARHPHDRVHAAWLYDERMASLLHAFKFGGRGMLVTAVPLHRARLRERGYDQAALLAEGVADALELPFVPGLLVRVRATQAQSTLGPDARRRNLAGAFQLAHPGAVRARPVLLIDDVLTTGATLHEGLRTLRAAGARPLGAALAWAQ